MSNEDEHNFQRRQTQDSIIFGGIITVGSTVFAIGATLWILSLTVLDQIVANQTTVINLDGLNRLTLIFLSCGLVTIILGFSLPMIPLRNKTKKNKESEMCNCQNPILCCPIHNT